LEFRNVGFEERGKPEYPEKNLSQKGLLVKEILIPPAIFLNHF